MIFFDTETCGLHGPIVLLQEAINDGPINLHHVWKNSIQQSKELIEDLCNHNEGICGFNLSYDWFHCCQFYTVLLELLKIGINRNDKLIDHIDEYALLEPKARFGPCLKPQTAFDIMLHARKGPYQSTMNRAPITIKKVPEVLAQHLCNELDKRIPLKEIYFAKKENPNVRWQTQDVFDDLGDYVPDFKNVILRFAPSSALKALAYDALGYKKDDILLFMDIELPRKAYPKELGYAPYALAIGDPRDWKGAWPQKIKIHINHWLFNKYAQRYAKDDVKYTRELYDFFGRPDAGDDDSILACMVGAVRWKGYKIDIEALKNLRMKMVSLTRHPRFNPNSPQTCKDYLYEVMSNEAKVVLKGTTKGIYLEEIEKWVEEKVCDDCNGQGCNNCEDGLIKSNKRHPAAIRAEEILTARHAIKEIEIYDKLLTAGRFHASFKVIGARSSRMSGSDDLNPQGIKRAEYVRQCFPLADEDMILCGGDFEGFEVVLMDAVYDDPDLRADLLLKRKCLDCNGDGCKECNNTGQVPTKIHGLFGQYLFPGKSYDQLLATKGLPGEKDLYTRSKNGVFALSYGGEAYTLKNRVGISEQAANEAYQKWIQRYKKWGRERKKYFDMFCSMKQPGGLGTKVEWHEPADFIESPLGFKRYFTLENQICKALYDLGTDPPKGWKNLKIKVTRRDREQTVGGATQTALFAAAFALQSANMRAAGNHVIQSYGAELNKMLQRRLWKLQPKGINNWIIQPMNVHDEIMSPMKEEISLKAEDIVHDFIKEMKPRVPLLEIDWTNNLTNWADK